MAEWPTGHLWADTQLVLLNKDRQEHGTIERAKGLKYKCRLFGDGSFSFSLHELDDFSQYIRSALLNEERLFVLIRRDGSYQPFCGVVYSIARKYDVHNLRTQYYEVTGSELTDVLRWRTGIPIAPAETLVTTDYMDDAMKWVVERCFGATAPDSPDGNTRTMAGFVVAADKSEYPSTTEFNATRRVLFDFFRRRGAAATPTVDFQCYFQANGDAYDIVFETYSPRRGEDRTESNTDGNDPVVINDEGDNIPAADLSIDLYDTQTSRMDATLRHEETDATAEASLLRVEGVSSSGSPDVIVDELHDHRPKKSYPIEFKETEDCQLFVHFNVGDKITYGHHELGFGPIDDTVAEAEVWFDDEGIEYIKLVLGDPVPTFFDKIKGGRAHNNLDWPANAVAALRDEAGTLAWFAEDNSLPVVGDEVYVETEATLQTIGGIEYEVIKIKAIGSLVNHNVLSATHADSVEDDPVRGDLIVGNSDDPCKWQRLALGSEGTYLRSDGTDAQWGSIQVGDLPSIDHDALLNVTADQHHSAYIGNLGDEGDGADPDAANKISILGATPGYYTNAHDNQVDIYGPWTRADAGSSDDYLRPTIYADDIRLQSAAATDVIWLEGNTGKSHFASDMYIGNAAGANAGFRLHVKDTRDTCGMLVENAQGSQAGFSIDDTSGTQVINNISGASVSIQVESVELAHFSSDKANVKITNSVVLGGYDTGDVLQWSFDCDNGNSFWKAGAIWTLEGNTYRPPTSAPSNTNAILGVSSLGPPNQLTWREGNFGTPGTLTAITTNVAGNNHTHAITASSDVASGGSALLKSDANGYLRIARLEFNGANGYLNCTNENYPSMAAAIRWRFIAGTGEVRMDASSVYPYTSLMLGSNLYRWSELNAVDGDFTGKLLVGANAAAGLDGDICASRSATTGAYYFGGTANYIYYDGSIFRITGGIRPSTSSSFDLGTSSYKFDTAYFSGTVYCGAVYLTAYGKNTGNWTIVAGTGVWTPVYAESGGGGGIVGYFEYFQHRHALE